MRTDQTAAELAQPQAPPGESLDDANEDVPQPPVRALTGFAFWFAWLFGLEPFLTGSPDHTADSRLDRD
jgi:hypothetical protein